MPHFKDKFQVFIMGLMLGLLIGGGFFILKLDDYFKELNFYKRLSLSGGEKTEEKTESKTGDKPNSNYKVNEPYKPLTAESRADSTNKAEAILNAGSDSIEVQDSSIIPTTLNVITPADEIVVRKDELITTKQADLMNLSVGASTNKDSLLQKASGIRDDKNVVKQAMIVEFWRSPINYKGYKMAKNKVVLFGIMEQEEVKLYKLDETVFIKLQQGIYRLDYSDDFRQFERINDESVIARLK